MATGRSESFFTSLWHRAALRRVEILLALAALIAGAALAGGAAAGEAAGGHGHFAITPPDPPNGGILFVDQSQADRSSHLGHALVEHGPGRILAFYPTCSGKKGGLPWMGPEWAGHNADGWMEYRRSDDGGKTWSEPAALEYSKRTYDRRQGRSVFCEKAVLAADGTIVLFNLECDIASNTDWNPPFTPTVSRSGDGGETWSEPQELGSLPGRVFDALTMNDSILALTHHPGERAHVIYASRDHGKTFAPLRRLPFRSGTYGTMEVLQDGRLIVYVYNPDDERRLDYAISADGGASWAEPQTAVFAKKIRNPQLAAFKGVYVLHGRSGHVGADRGDLGHLVLYTSRDGVNWDEGRYLCMKTAGAAAYSNNLLVDGGKRLLIQASHAYDRSKANVLHWWLD